MYDLVAMEANHLLLRRTLQYMVGEPSMIGVRTLTIARQLNSKLASYLMFGPPLVGLEWSLWLQNGPNHLYSQWSYVFLLGRVTSPCIASLIL